MIGWVFNKIRDQLEKEMEHARNNPKPKIDYRGTSRCEDCNQLMWEGGYRGSRKTSICTECHQPKHPGGVSCKNIINHKCHCD